MKQRGRQSKKAAELVVIDGDFGKKRPDPPPELTPEQAMVWTSVAQDEPLDHFSTAATREMLGDYCVHRAEAARLVRVIGEFPDAGLKNKAGLQHYSLLARDLQIHTRAAASLATKLRLTNQSRYTPQAAATASRNTMRGLKPWDWG